MISTLYLQTSDHVVGEEDPASPGDSRRRGLGGWTGRDPSHEVGDPPHAGPVQSAHETTGEDDPGYGEVCVKVRSLITI